jgi:hypothetical protein
LQLPTGLAVEWVPAILILAGVAASSRLVAAGSKTMQALLNAVGFLVGIGLLLLAVSAIWKGPIDSFTFTLSAVAGLLLILRPLKNVRWAALLGLAAGALASYFVWSIFGVATQFILLAVGIAVALVIYVMFKFAEDLLHVIGGILNFPPVAVAIGLTAIIHGILLMLGSGVPQLLGPISLPLLFSR